MEKLTYITKLSVVKILSEILHADNRVHEKEVEYLNEVIKMFNLESNHQTDIDNLGILQALSNIRILPAVQKEEIAKMMGKMIVVDKDINYNEVKMYNVFCDSCNIEKDFNMDDYPGISLSGPYINPEDLMNAI